MLKQLGDAGSCRAYHQLMHVLQGRIAMELWIYTEKHGFSKSKLKAMQDFLGLILENKFLL